jgi:5'-nucleotidase
MRNILGLLVFLRSSMRILLTNDDGIDAPGIRALRDSVRQALGEVEITVVAPDRQRSECGHSVTSHRRLNICEVEQNWYSVDGTPVDCVRVALTTLVVKPSMVVSGINAGANLGVDLLSSGTYAAAREAAIHGVPAMAISHYRRPDIPRSWDHAPGWLSSTIQDFRHRIQNSDGCCLWNVNLPAIDPHSDPPERHWCEVDRCPIDRSAKRDPAGVLFESNFHARPRESGTDVDRCFGGALTISELSPHV